MDFNKLQQLAIAKGITELEVYQEKKNGISVSVYHKTVEQSQFESTNVLAIRGVYDNKIGLYYTEKEQEDWDKALDKLIENISLQTIVEPYFIYPGDSNYPEVQYLPDDFEEYTLKDKIDACLELEELIMNYDPLVVDVQTVEYGEIKKEISILNTNGLNLTNKTHLAYFVGSCVVKKGDEIKTNYDLELKKRYSEFNIKALAAKIAKEGLDKLGGAPCESAHYPTIIQNETMSSLLGAFANLFSAEAAIKNMTFLKGLEGQKVFGDNITIIDDPLDPLAFANFAFDDEGVASKTKEVVTNGVFNTMLHNLKTAKMFNTQSTGNGFKHSVQSPVSVLPTNFRLVGGDSSLDDLLKACNNGIYITDLGGLHAGINPISGDFSLQASGFLVEAGKITTPVTLIVVSGNIKDVLSDVALLGNDTYYSLSNIGAPSVLFNKMAVSGK